MNPGDDEARDRAAQEDAWREIVDHYGERAQIDEDPTVQQPAPPRPALETPAPEPFVFEPYADRFHPLPIEPAPPTTPERRAAWAAVLLSPVVLMVCAVIHWRLPGVLTGALVLAFLGGFGYLVATMPRERDDPYDDGARL